MTSFKPRISQYNRIFVHPFLDWRYLEVTFALSGIWRRGRPARSVWWKCRSTFNDFVLFVLARTDFWGPSLISCPGKVWGQLNRWQFHSLTEWLLIRHCARMRAGFFPKDGWKWKWPNNKWNAHNLMKSCKNSAKRPALLLWFHQASSE